MSRLRTAILRREKLARAAAPPTKQWPGLYSPPRCYTEEEWSYLVSTPSILERQGEAAAREWLAAHPHPDNIPDWILLDQSFRDNAIFQLDPEAAELLRQAWERHPNYQEGDAAHGLFPRG